MVFGNTLLATALSSDYLLFRRHLVALQDCLLHLLHTYPCSTDARFTRLSFEHYREWTSLSYITANQKNILNYAAVMGNLWRYRASR